MTNNERVSEKQAYLIFSGVILFFIFVGMWIFGALEGSLLGKIVISIFGLILLCSSFAIRKIFFSFPAIVSFIFIILYAIFYWHLIINYQEMPWSTYRGNPITICWFGILFIILARWNTKKLTQQKLEYISKAPHAKRKELYEKLFSKKLASEQTLVHEGINVCISYRWLHFVSLAAWVNI